MSALTREKLAQAASLVGSHGLDVWITFVRETFGGSDPVLPLIFEGGLTWLSALLVFRDARKVAVVGNYDAEPLESSGDWDEVVPYVQSIREPLVACLRQAGVRRIGANFSSSDDKSDGLTHGMFQLLSEIVSPLGAEIVSAEGLVSELRGRKSPEEVRRMRAAIAETDRLFELIGTIARAGVSERAIQQQVHEAIAERGLGFAWERKANPIVNSGPNSMIGHGVPSLDIVLEEGQVFHIDLGVVKDDYASDLQRCWYVGSSVPSDVEQALEAVNAAITAGAARLKPGVQGWQVDEAARKELTGHGYEEYLHALGHQVGRVAHDGGTVLAPQWERYGDTPLREVREGEVYTLELGVILPERGYLGLEEMVQVTADGVEWLSSRQLDMPLIGSQEVRK